MEGSGNDSVARDIASYTEVRGSYPINVIEHFSTNCRIPKIMEKESFGFANVKLVKPLVG